MKHFAIRNPRASRPRRGSGLPARLLPILLCASLFLALAGPAAPAAAAGILYVDRASSCTTSCGGSWANAYPYLQDALAAAVSGDQVWVAEGVYYPDEGAGQTDNAVVSIFTLKIGVAVYGGFAGTETLLTQRSPKLHPTILSGDLQQDDVNSDGNFIAETNLDIQNNNALHVVQASSTDQTTVLDGFVITAGNANGANPTVNSGIGGGVLALDGNPTLSHLLFSGNNATINGGGLFSGSTVPGTQLNPAPILSEITLSGNAAMYGGGMFIDNSFKTQLVDITFDGNAAKYGGGMYTKNSNQLQVTNVTFSANTAGQDGGGMYNESSSPEIYNATWSGNSALGSGGGMYNYQSGVTLANSILANTLSGGGCASSTGSTLSAAYSNLFEDSANTCGATSSMGSNILGVDPQLAGLADNGGFTPTFALLPGSPAIDRSLANNLCPSSDQRGAGRPQDGDQNGTAYCDLGAYEVGGILYVDQASTCSSDCGSSWATAYPKLQDALASALSGGQVWVAQGVYYPDEGAGQTDNDVLSIFTVVKGVAVYGGFAGGETGLEQRNPRLHPAILSGDLQQDDVNSDGNFIDETNYDIRNDNALHVVQINNTDQTTVLDGFVITAGNANGANPAPNAGIGGGVLALDASPVLANLVLSGNNATLDGGGLYSGPPPSSTHKLVTAPVLSEITFTGNLAWYGGGMFIQNSSATRLENITFRNNAANYGGGLYVKLSDPVLTNLTIGGNTASMDGGGIYNESSSPTLMNVTLSDNLASGSGGGIYNYKTTPSFTNTLIANSSSGGDCVNDPDSSLGSSGNNLIEDNANACGLTDNTNGNIIGTNPQLGSLANNGGSTQTFALLSGSAAIDAGTDLGCPASDQRGMARPYGSHCDIGAYEKTASLLFLPVMIR